MMAVNEWSLRPFVWGKSDCCITAAQIVRAVTGRWFFAGFEYSTEEEAKKIVDKYGSLGTLVDALEVGASVPGPMVLDGDPLLLDLPGVGETLGFRMGDRAIYRTQRGFMSISILSDRVVRGWQVK